MFGEMALIDGSSRSATAHAKAKCEVLPITEKDFLPWWTRRTFRTCTPSPIG
jgi:CRP-like cAMP-binding protein